MSQHASTRTQRARRPFAFFVLVGIASAGSAALAHVWVRTQLVELGYALASEKQAAEELAQANQRLRIEVEWLKSPARVEAIAKRELQMEPLDPAHLRAPARIAKTSLRRGASLRAALASQP